MAVTAESDDYILCGMVGMMMTVVEMINNDELSTWIIFTLRSSVQLVQPWADWAEQTDKIRSLSCLLLNYLLELAVCQDLS